MSSRFASYVRSERCKGHARKRVAGAKRGRGWMNVAMRGRREGKDRRSNGEKERERAGNKNFRDGESPGRRIYS